MKNQLIFCIRIIVILIFVICCNSCQKTAAKLPDAVITFSFGKVKVNSVDAEAGTEIRQNDVIITENESSAVIQIGESVIIAIKENSELKLDLLSLNNGNNNVKAALNSGGIFNKIKKGSCNYSVQAGSVLAAVRGTSFSVNKTAAQTSEIKLLNGTVEITHTPSGKITTLNEMEFISAADKTLTPASKLSDADKTDLEKLDSIKLLQRENLEELNLNKKSVKDVVPESALPGLIDNKEKSEDKSVKKLTLEEIKKLHGAISRVILNNGNEYTGSFRQAGDKMEIITVNGTVKVSAANVSRVEPYKMK